MTDNEKIARWAGWTDHPMFHGLQPPEGSPMATSLPNYSTDAEAVQLLNVLVEKGYSFNLYHYDTESGMGICLEVNQKHTPYTSVVKRGASIHEAITAAVLQVIEKEKEDESND